MFPGCGKYLAFQRCERATLKQRKETSAPLICLATLPWKQIPEPNVRDALWTVVCECVCADSSSECVCEA